MHIGNTYIADRSGIVDRQECPRLRFLGRDMNGLGYQLIASRVPLLSGQHEHNALAEIVGHYGGYRVLDLKPFEDPIAHVLAKVTEEYSKEILEAGVRDLTEDEVVFTMQEQLTMLEGVARGFVYYRLPRLLDEFDVVDIEHDHLFELGAGIKIPIREDVVFRRKADGLLFIDDYKGIPYGDDAWQRTHEQSLQTVLYIEGLEQRTGEAVGGMMYEGLVRGQWRTDTAKMSPYSGRKIQQTPYCYGWHNPDNYEYPEKQSKYTNRKGFVKFRVADEPDLSVKDWLEVLITEGVLPELFIKMEPAQPTPEFRARVRRQALLGEQRYLRDLESLQELLETRGWDDPEVQAHLDLMAPQHTNRCYKYGQDSRCQFADHCPMIDGGLVELAEDESFKIRVPHHDMAVFLPMPA